MNPTNNSASFAEVIKALREKIGLSQEQLAQKLGVSSRTISRWEVGEAEPKTSAQKARIAELLKGAGLNLALTSLGWGISSAMVGAVGGLLAAPIMGAVLAYSTKSKADLYRRKSEVLDAVEQTAEKLGLSSEGLIREIIKLTDITINAGMTMQDFRNLLSEVFVD